MVTDGIVIGFTGTRHALTEYQKREISRLLGAQTKPVIGVHGDCVGADAYFHEACIARGFDVQIRPCNIESMRAYCEGATLVHEPEDPLVRNRKIVDSCDFLLAAPNTETEQRRSGTWSTIRYAQRIRRSTIIVWPSVKNREVTYA